MSTIPERWTGIADAGPLVALAGIHSPHLSKALFGEIFITRTVCDEIFPKNASFDDAPDLRVMSHESGFHIGETDTPSGRYPVLDSGEARVVRLAKYMTGRWNGDLARKNS